MTLGNAAGEEAALANVIVEMLQTSIPAQIKGRGGEGGGGGGEEGRLRINKSGKIYGCVLSPAASS